MYFSVPIESLLDVVFYFCFYNMNSINFQHPTHAHQRKEEAN